MLKCSHILCKVHDIGAAVRDYQALGFTVAWGSVPERAHNALLWFEEGPFIELFELPARHAWIRYPFGWLYGSAAGDRLAHWAASGEGLCDIALEPASVDPSLPDVTDLRAAHSAVRALGVPASRIVRGRRRRPDREWVHYRFFAPEPSCLPFVVSPYHPAQRPWRVTHPNGAQRVGRVSMSVGVGERGPLQALLGDDPVVQVEEGERTAVLEVSLVGIGKPLDSSFTHGAQWVPTGAPLAQRAHAGSGAL